MQYKVENIHSWSLAVHSYLVFVLLGSILDSAVGHILRLRKTLFCVNQGDFKNIYLALQCAYRRDEKNGWHVRVAMHVKTVNRIPKNCSLYIMISIAHIFCWKGIACMLDFFESIGGCFSSV